MSNAGEWQRPTRRARLTREIEEPQRIRSLIPTDDDFLKYSLTTEEVLTMIPDTQRLRDQPRIIKWRETINAVMVVLRKRDAENPGVPIELSELREAINVLIDDEPFGSVAFFVINLLQRQGLIDTNNWRYVNIVKPKIAGVMSVPF